MADSDPVEHVDEAGNVVEIVTRAEMRSRGLRHRATYVAVLDGAGRLVVHRRADWKDVYPGFWDVAFGGVCDPGESWGASARRELAEEAGLGLADLEPPGPVDLGSVAHRDDHGEVIGRFFLVRSDAPITPVDGEVVEVDCVPLPDLDRWAGEREVCPDSLGALRGFRDRLV